MQLIAVLSDLQSTLDKASVLLNQYRLDEAGQTLDQAGVSVAQAQILLSQLKDATLTITQRLQVLGAPAGSKLRQAYDQLDQMLQELADLINQYHYLLTRANQRVDQIKSQNLGSTKLSLSLNTTKCFVGGYVAAYGTLTSDGEVMPNRNVQLLLDGNKETTETTQEDGSYYAIIKMPFKYADYVSVSALYMPAGNDIGVYLAAATSSIKVQLLFYKTNLNISVANIAYPGLQLTITGNVAADDGKPSVERKVSVLLDGAVMTKTMTSQTGGFTSKFTVNPQATLGSHNLQVIVDPSGLYAGASGQKTVTIEKMMTIVDLNKPSIIVLPSQIHISGTVSSASNPLKGAVVQVQFANYSASTVTLNDGSFNFTVDMPLSAVLAGYQDLTVKVQPSEPWQASAQTKASILILNSVSITFALAASFSLFFVASFKLVKTKNKKQPATFQATNALTSPEKAAAVEAQSHLSPVKLEGNRGAVLEAYVEALKAVEHSSGDSLSSNMTLREYMQLTKRKIGAAADLFFDLTIMAEKSLYSQYEPQAEDVERAKNLTLKLGRTLNRGST